MKRWLFGALAALLSVATLGPALAVEPTDAPPTQRPPADFEVRGIHIDLRTQVMTMPALHKIAKDAAAEGINTLIMEWEATFPFERNAVLCNRYAYTKEEVQEFVAYCGELGIDVIPLQNCFGHCEYILRHARYNALREDRKEVSQVCPSKIAEAEAVFRDIFAEVVALHPSRYLHIGADETRLLGKCKLCAEKVKNEGVSALFVDYINAMCAIAAELGKQPIIWADMLLQYPEAIDKLPSNLIVADWNYGWSVTHFGDVGKIQAAGMTVWGASALRSAPDNTYLTQWNKHFENLATFIPYAREHGYKGMINTSWSTSGQYGFTYDNSWEIIEMQPVRQVYPLAGFDILQRAYGVAVNDSKPLDVPAFIREYAHKHFGFNKKDAEVLVAYFSMPQETVTGNKAKPERIGRLIDTCQQVRGELGRLHPKRGTYDFDQLCLMLDVRIHYLKFKQVEALYESKAFDASKRKEVVQQLEPLMAEAEALRTRFVALNGASLKNPTECFDAWTYIGKLRQIYTALARK